MSDEWEWNISPSGQQHTDRVPMLRSIQYETFLVVGHEEPEPPAQRGAEEGKALSLNISPGGMLLLMDKAPAVGQTIKVKVPTPVNQVQAPTLAEVRWTRPVPLAPAGNCHFVGLKFLV